MRKLFTLIASLFITSTVFCQLTVKPSNSNTDHFIYLEKKLLYVTGNIHLQKNTGSAETEASIYLREEAQLLQGSGSNAENTGNGLLSVFQEGTSNAYDYNYWSSPVGQGTEGNGTFGIRMLSAPQTSTRSSPAFIFAGLDGQANPLTISDHWIFTYSGVNYSHWKPEGDRSEIPAGRGFTMKGVNGTDPIGVNGRQHYPGNAQRYDLRGRPYNGNIEIAVAPETNMLVGNPYPSALDLSLFLIENSGSEIFSSSCYGDIARQNITTGIAYFWDSEENGNSHYLSDYVGGYGAFTPVDPCTTGIYTKPVFRRYGEARDQSSVLPGSLHYERRFTPIAQGFMIEGASNASLIFRNRHRIFRREGENSDFKLSTETGSEKSSLSQPRQLFIIPKILLQITINDLYVRQLTVGFWPTATSETDIGMDARAFDTFPTDVGWLQENRNYVIDVRPFARTEEIPLFLRVEENPVKLNFEVLNMENFNTDYVFIVDTLGMTYYSVKEESFQLELEPGIYHERFKLAFSKPSPEVPEEEIIRQKLEIFQNNSEQELQILNRELLPVTSVALYDLSGKQVFMEETEGKSKLLKFETGHLRNSVYLVRVFNKSGTVKTAKVSVQNHR